MQWIQDTMYIIWLRKLMFPDFMKTAQDGGKVVSLTQRQPLPPGN